WEEYESLQRRRFDEWGMPADKKDELLSFLSGPTLYGDELTLEPLSAGDRFDVGETTLEAVHMPGHTRGSTAFVTDDNEIYSGDALLPVYTPNIGGADIRVEQPLAAYLSTLQAFIDGGFDLALPGHRDPIADPAARAKEIYHHHEERAYRVLKALEEIGPASAWDVSAMLFGSLENIHIIHGPGEAFAHLDHLQRDGLIKYTDEGYRITEATANRLEEQPDPIWPLES
ncbi:MAG: MBL fold metallo-hydrolase, partial [Halobacteriales archaeon]